MEVSHLDLQIEDDVSEIIVAQDLTDDGNNVKRLNFTARPNRTYTVRVTRDANDPVTIANEQYALVSSFDLFA